MAGETEQSKSTHVNRIAQLGALVAEIAEKSIYGTGDTPLPGGRAATDPAQVIADIEEAVGFVKSSLQAEPAKPDWRKALRVQPKTWTEIVHLIDEPIPYVIWPLVVRGSMTQIQGLPKGGKSAFSLYLSACATTGIWPFPQYIRADDPLRVLYIAWEDPEIMMAKRLALYAKGLDLERTATSPNLTFLFGPDLFVDEQAGEFNLREAIRELRPDVVFIDTLSHIHRADENAASEMKIPMKNLDRIAKEENVGLVYLHHTKKGGDGAAQEKGRGSSSIAAAWHILVDWGKREDNSNVNPIEIQSKFEHDWIKWAITYDARKDEIGNVEQVRWQIEGAEIGNPTDLSSKAIKFNKIIEASRRLAISNPPEGWVTSMQIANACGLGIDSKAIKRHLQQLCQDGWLEFKEGINAHIPNMYRPIKRERGNLEV